MAQRPQLRRGSEPGPRSSNHHRERVPAEGSARREGHAARRPRGALMTASPLLTIESKIDTAGHTLAVTGEVDMATAPQLRQEILGRLSGAETLFLDLSGVSFMGLDGVHVLVASQRRAGLLDKQIVLSRASSAVERVLDLTGTSPMFATGWRRATQ